MCVKVLKIDVIYCERVLHVVGYVIVVLLLLFCCAVGKLCFPLYCCIWPLISAVKPGGTHFSGAAFSTQTFVWTMSEDSLARDLESQLKTSPDEELDYMDVDAAPVHSSLDRPSPKVGTACYVGPTESGNGSECPVSCHTNDA